MMLMTNRKAALSSALALVMAGLSSPGHAMEFKVSGQLDRAFTVADNGNETDYASVDNIGSNSRFRFTGNEKMANGMNVGFIYEMSVVQFGSTEFDIGKNSGGVTLTWIPGKLTSISRVTLVR